MKLDHRTRDSWAVFLGNEQNLGHSTRSLVGNSIDTHVDACWRSAKETALRIEQDIPEQTPQIILEIGASAGLNCFAMQQQWPQSMVIGIEPELAAVRAAQAMANSMNGTIPQFILGVGESIPLPDNSVDLIVCHTVIEHVNNIDNVISEMTRVLSPNGILHLEAPNYVWPYEPHLEIWCIPLLGKPSVRLAARIQGKQAKIPFLTHLQFVTPSSLESLFKKHGLIWENRVETKLSRVLSGDYEQIKAYRRAAMAMRILSLAGLSKILLNFVLKTNLYPSVLYTCRKKRGN